MNKFRILVTIFFVLIAGILSGCIDTLDQKIVYEGLRDAPSNPNDPNYEDYINNIFKYQELYTMTIDGLNIQRLTNNKFYESQADVSPDGTHIVMSILYKPEGSITGIEPGWEIAVMKSHGSYITNLTNNTWLDTGAHWNYNSTKIVYLSDTAHRTVEDLDPENYTPIQLDVYTMNADGSEPKQLTFAYPGEIYSDPSYSFTSPSKILYVYDADGQPPQNYDLYMMNEDGGNKTLIIKHDHPGLQAIAINDPMFSSDDRSIIFEAEMGKDQWNHSIFQIFTVDTFGNNLLKITKDDQVSEGMAQFSPTRTWITFDRVIWTSATDGTRKIWLANCSEGNERCLSSFRYEGCASWFPPELFSPRVH